ncbi:MAG: glycosyltransferase family 4 protein [Bacteroidota bacterium]
MKKVLIVTAHRLNRAPNQRFRFEQYLEYLKANGFDCTVSYLLDAEADAVFYKPGHWLKKLSILLNAIKIRMADTKRVKQFDLVFICREAFLIGTTYFERKFVDAGVPTVFDFDDAIWNLDVSEGNKRLAWLKKPSKTSEIIQMVNHVIAGNQYLANYAAQFNKNVSIIPTTLDTDYHRPSNYIKEKNQSVCIGWTGSLTTVKHFRLAEPLLKRIKEKYQDSVSFKVIGDSNYYNQELNIQGVAWSLEKEIEELQAIDIGIMPLPDDEWAKGKCGFKGLTYMSMGVPAIMSPVGINMEIIQHGENGFLAKSDDEWFDLICYLIDYPEERKRMGVNARKTVVDFYSVSSQKEKYLSIFKMLTS